jgi:hypothetical protein
MSSSFGVEESTVSKPGKGIGNGLDMGQLKSSGAAECRLEPRKEALDNALTSAVYTVLGQPDLHLAASIGE